MKQETYFDEIELTESQQRHVNQLILDLNKEFASEEIPLRIFASDGDENKTFFYQTDMIYTKEEDTCERDYTEQEYQDNIISTQSLHNERHF